MLNFSIPDYDYVTLFYVVFALGVLASLTTQRSGLGPLLVSLAGAATLVFASRSATYEAPAPAPAPAPQPVAPAKKRPSDALVHDVQKDMMFRYTRNQQGGEPLEARDRLVRMLYGDGSNFGNKDPFMERIN